MSYVLDVAKKGKSVWSTEERDFSLLSDKGTFGIYKEGGGAASGAGVATIAHGLDFVPAFMVYDDNNWKGAGYYGINHTSYINGTNLNIVTGADKNYKYKIYYNKIAGSVSTTKIPAGYQIIVTKGNKNVHNATFEDVKFWSAKQTMQVWEQYSSSGGVSDISDIQTWFETEIPHNLGYIPAYVALSKVTAEQLDMSYIPDFDAGHAGAGTNMLVEVCADSSKYYWRYQHGFTVPEEFRASAFYINIATYGNLT